MKKKLLTYVLIFIPLVVNAYDSEINGIFYNLNTEDKTASVTYGDRSYSGDIVIPNSIEIDGIQYTVTALSERSFAYCGINSITIPSSLNAIDRLAFINCSYINNVIIDDLSAWCNLHFGEYITWSSDNLVTYHLYLGENELTDLVIPGDIKEIGKSAFEYCISVKKVILSEGVERIMDAAFYGCTKLESITLPNSLKIINSYSFQNCTNLKEILFNSSLESVGELAFGGCENLESIRIDNLEKWCSINFNGRLGTNPLFYAKHFYCCDSEITELYIPETVKSIGVRAFYCFSGLTYLHIPESVLEIGYEAFAGCENVQTMYINSDAAFKGYIFGKAQLEDLLSYKSTKVNKLIIGKSVTSITEGAFLDCDISLINVDGDNPIFDSRNNCNAIIDTESSILMLGCKNTAIPSDVVQIGTNAFSQCNFTNIKIPNSITVIGKQAFYECKNLSEINIPSSVSIIMEEAFKECSALKKVVIEDLSAWCNIDFQVAANDGTNPLSYAGHLYVGDTEITKVELPNTVTAIKTYAFDGFTAMKSITIPSSVQSIGRSAFNCCSGLTTISIPESVSTIGYAAFTWCTGLKTVTLPNSIVSIGDYSFAQCRELESITLSENLTVIPTYCFFNCSKLKSITIPDHVSKICQHSFYDCNSLQSIYLGKGLNHIMDQAFQNCNNLTKVTCMAQDPPQSSYPRFNYSATLLVPASSVEGYRSHNQWGRFSKIEGIVPETYKLVYMVDDVVYKSYEIEVGTVIIPEVFPEKEKYRFSGWSDLPTTMPAHDVTVSGSFVLCGDVNNDGVVNAVDLVEMVNYTMDIPSNNFNKTAADLNEDNEINATDIEKVASIIMKSE